MAGEMRVTADALTQAAEKFDHSSEELNGSINRVRDDIQGVKAQFTGSGGDALQGAGDRFYPAAEKLQRALTDLSQNIHAASGQYTKADDEQAATMAQQMNI
jgi:WXG100 family type VII secretion target